MLGGDIVGTAHLALFNSSSFFLTLPFIACILNTILGHYTIMIRMCVFEKLKCRSCGVKSGRIPLMSSSDPAPCTEMLQVSTDRFCEFTLSYFVVL